MNGCIIPENEEKCISPQQENAVFLVMGDEAYTDEMIDEYNRNAEAKTEEFNTNATNKLNAFNENATTKTNEFNTNATTQTDTYNSNAATKLSEYNDNATAKEQSYNSNADTKTQAFNQNAAQKEYEFNQNALAYQEGIEKNAEEIDEVSNRVYRIENNLYDSGTAEGYFINIEDSSYSEFQNVSVDGASEQVTTTGKNKLQITTFNDGTKSKTLNGVTANINENGTISLSGTASAETQFYLTKNDFSLESGDGYFWCNSPSVNCRFEFVASINGEEKYLNSYSTTPNTFNITSSFVYSGSTIIVASGTSTNVTLTPMISNGTFTEYEPYTGGQPSPSPDYPQEIEVIEEDFNITSCGKNLLPYPYEDTTKTVNGISFTDNKDGSITVNGTATANASFKLLGNSEYSEFVRIYANYLYGGTNNSWVRVVNYTNGHYTVICTSKNNEGIGIDKTTYNTGYVEIIVPSGYTAENEIITPMMTIKQATEYEPYQSTTTAITLPDEQFAAKISDTAKDQFRIAYDESDGNYHLYLDKNVGKIVLNGSESWKDNWQSSNSPDYIYFYLSADFLDNNYNPYNLGNLISNNFQCSGSVWNSDRELLALNADMTKSLQISMLKSRVSDLTSFKQWLQSHNTTVYYQLANPQTIDIGKVQMPLTYYPITNVLTDCPLQPNIEVAYYRDFKTTIETMQEDIASNTSRIETLEEQLQSQATTISNLENRVTALEPAQTESEVVEQ